MAKAPIDYVSLKPAKFLTDSDCQVWDSQLNGAYAWIIFNLYTEGGLLENDPEKLRVLAHWRGDGWDEAWNKLRKKFSETKRGLRHKYVTKELARARERHKVRRSAGLTGAEVRWQTHNKRNADAVQREGKGREVREEATPPTPPRGNGEVRVDIDHAQALSNFIREFRVFSPDETNKVRLPGYNTRGEEHYDSWAKWAIGQPADFLGRITAKQLRQARDWAKAEKWKWGPGTFRQWWDEVGSKAGQKTHSPGATDPPDPHTMFGYLKPAERADWMAAAKEAHPDAPPATLKNEAVTLWEARRKQETTP